MVYRQLNAYKSAGQIINENSVSLRSNKCLYIPILIASCIIQYCITSESQNGCQDLEIENGRA